MRGRKDRSVSPWEAKPMRVVMAMTSISPRTRIRVFRPFIFFTTNACTEHVEVTRHLPRAHPCPGGWCQGVPGRAGEDTKSLSQKTLVHLVSFVFKSFLHSSR